MTIVLVILAVLILLAVLFLIFHVSKLSEAHRELMGNYHTAVIDSILDLQKTITTQVNTTTSIIGAQQQEVIRLTNKVEDSNSSCKDGINSLKHTIATLDARLTSPIDKINDTHNRIKTLGKSATSTDELRTVVSSVISAAVTEAVDVICQKCAPKPKTTKKVTKELDKELIKEANA